MDDYEFEVFIDNLSSLDLNSIQITTICNQLGQQLNKNHLYVVTNEEKEMIVTLFSQNNEEDINSIHEEYC